MSELVPRPTERPVAVSAIPFAHWSMTVGRDGEAWGEIVTQIDDLNQGIANLLLTPVGSVPTEPEKGCDVLEVIDYPPEIAIPRLTVTIWDALLRWHPRIVVDSVQVTPIDEAHYRCPLFWRPAAFVANDFIQSNIELSRSRIASEIVSVPEELLS